MGGLPTWLGSLVPTLAWRLKETLVARRQLRLSQKDLPPPTLCTGQRLVLLQNCVGDALGALGGAGSRKEAVRKPRGASGGVAPPGPASRLPPAERPQLRTLLCPTAQDPPARL